MDPRILLAEKVAVSAGIGLLIGLEREWRHKEVGVRSFTIVALLGTLAWLVSPTFALVEVGVVGVIIVLANVYLLLNKQPMEITTALALAVTNVLGVLIGGGFFFLALACAIVVTTLLSWKTELIEFTSRLTVAEIRGTLLMAFIAAVIYPLLPDLAMIFRNGALVAIFSWPAGPEATIATLLVLGPMLLIAALLALFSLLRAAKKNEQTSQSIDLRSPLDLRSVLRFGLLFLSLTVLSGLGELLFGAVGFLLVVVVGALASAASSAVLVGTHVLRQQISPGTAVLALFLATVVGLVENVVIVYSVSRNRAVGVRLSLFTLPIVLAGGLALALTLLTGW